MDIQSAWLSKTNWTQAVAFLAVMFTMFGIELDEATQAAIVATIATSAQVVTWVLRTFFTKTITPAVAAKLEQ